MDLKKLVVALVAELMEELDPCFCDPSQKKHIYCYLPMCGGNPSREFLDSQSTKVKATYAKQFEKVCAGAQLRGDRWHPWTEDDGKDCKGLYEYKDISSKTRIMSLVEGNIHVLLFGFSGKKEDKVDPGHVKRAIDMKKEYQARRAQIEARLAKQGGGK